MLCCFQSHGHPKIDTISAALTSVTRAGNAPPTPADSANTSLTHNFALAPCLHASQGTICTATPSHNNYGETCYLYISKRKNYLFNIDIEGSLVYPIKSSEPGAHVYRKILAKECTPPSPHHGYILEMYIMSLFFKHFLTFYIIIHFVQIVIC